MKKEETKKEVKKESKKTKEEITYVDAKGKRADGRGIGDLRDIKIEVGVLKRADGSCYLEWGQNKILASVYGPREFLPKHLANPYRATVRYVYRMTTFSVPDRKNPRPGRREIEISKVSAEALERSIFLEKFPNSVIDVFVQISDSNAGTRVAALTAAACALADAGIPMKDIVSSVSVGRAGGNMIVDLTKEEEDAPDAVDAAMAILPSTEEIVLLQMDGEMKLDEWKKLQKLGIEACKKVNELQAKALKEKYARSE
jgi:exosome complex component RRP41